MKNDDAYKNESRDSFESYAYEFLYLYGFWMG